MADVHRLPDADAAEREASEWIARLNADDVSVADRARFEAWRSAHPRHARAYEALAATWQHFNEAGSLVRAVSFGQAMNEAGSAARPSRRWALAAAASVAAAVLAGGWHAVRMESQTRFQTAIGEHASVRLPDGSSLEINSDSRAHVDYSSEARVIRLERGEAFFEVAHDEQRPFWVVAGDSWIRAVGTAFDVYLRADGVRVTVSEGRVKVLPRRAQGTPSDTVLGQAAVPILAAGQQADLSSNTAQIRSLDAEEVTRAISWTRGMLYFDKQRLGAVVDELNRYTPLKIVVDEALRDLPVSGTFRTGPQGTQAFLAMLEDGLGLTVRSGAGDRRYIEGEPAE